MDGRDSVAFAHFWFFFFPPRRALISTKRRRNVMWWNERHWASHSIGRLLFPDVFQQEKKKKKKTFLHCCCSFLCLSSRVESKCRVAAPPSRSARINIRRRRRRGRTNEPTNERTREYTHTKKREKWERGRNVTSSILRYCRPVVFCAVCLYVVVGSAENWVQLHSVVSAAQLHTHRRR